MATMAPQVITANKATGMTEFGPFAVINDARDAAREFASKSEQCGTVFVRDSNGKTEPSGSFYSLFVSRSIAR